MRTHKIALTGGAMINFIDESDGLTKRLILLAELLKRIDHEDVLDADMARSIGEMIGEVTWNQTALECYFLGRDRDGREGSALDEAIARLEARYGRRSCK